MIDRMKKIRFCVIVMLFALHGLTSCLEKGKDESTGYVLGVLNHDEGTGFYILNTQDTFAVYCPEFKDKVVQGEMEAGGCYYVVYIKDNTLPENALYMVRANRYITASLIKYDVAVKYNLNESLIDTSAVLVDEIAVLDAKPSNEVFGYSEGYLFMTHKIVSQEGYTFDWSLSYNEETMMPTTVDKKNYYDLFLRATIAANSNQTDTIEHFSLNAYHLEEYLTEAANKEKEFLSLNSTYNASSTFTVRINYVSGIKGDMITWKSAEFPAKITFFIPE
jgi:hypothetical protein